MQVIIILPAKIPIRSNIYGLSLDVKTAFYSQFFFSGTSNVICHTKLDFSEVQKRQLTIKVLFESFSHLNLSLT